MKSLCAVMNFSLKLLIRDKVFIPSAIAGLLILLFAGMASGWTVENYEKVLYDIGFAGFHFTGGIVALLWGAKIIGDFKNDGTIELELATPVSKPLWFVGKYLGLFMVLFTLAAILILVWQGVLYYFDYQILRYPYAIAFFMFVLEWWVIAALAFFFSSFASTTTSLFCTLALWVLGMIVEPVYQATRDSDTGVLGAVVEQLARFWNLQKFNFSDITLSGQLPESSYILNVLVYGTSLIGIWLLLGSLIFSRRQMQ